MCTTDTLTSKRCGGKLRHCRDYWGAKYAMVFQNNKNLSLTNVTIREIKNSFEYDVFFASHLWEPLSECDCSIKMAFLKDKEHSTGISWTYLALWQQKKWLLVLIWHVLDHSFFILSLHDCQMNKFNSKFIFSPGFTHSLKHLIYIPNFWLGVDIIKQATCFITILSLDYRIS